MTKSYPAPRLLDIYKKEIVPHIMKEKQHTNIHQVPKITKIVLTSCLGDYFRDQKAFESIREDFESIALQKSVTIVAKKSVAAFHLRAGMPLGYKSTLRGKTMYYFLDRLVNVILVLNREYRGTSTKSITGNKKSGFAISIGIKDMSEFPEVEKTSLKQNKGIGITIVSNARTKEMFEYLLKMLNFPLIKEGK